MQHKYNRLKQKASLVKIGLFIVGYIISAFFIQASIIYLTGLGLVHITQHLPGYIGHWADILNKDSLLWARQSKHYLHTSLLITHYSASFTQHEQVYLRCFRRLVQSSFVLHATRLYYTLHLRWCILHKRPHNGVLVNYSSHLLSMVISNRPHITQKMHGSIQLSLVNDDYHTQSTYKQALWDHTTHVSFSKHIDVEKLTKIFQIVHNNFKIGEIAVIWAVHKNFKKFHFEGDFPV